MLDRRSPRLWAALVQLRRCAPVFSARTGAPTLARVILAAMVAACAACSLDLDYLEAREAGSDASGTDHPEARDASITDAPVGNTRDQTSGDTARDVEDFVDAGGIDATLPSDADAGGMDATTTVVDAGPGDPALPPDASTVTCPTTIDDSLVLASPGQTGRLSRVNPASTCGTAKAFPGTSADPTNAHFYRAYRFANAGDASACYTFELIYGADAGDDASMPNNVPGRYMAAYSTFYPANLGTGYLGDVGGQLTPPQSMAVTVSPGGTVDVVVNAVDVAPAGAGDYTLSCTAE
jgi:hypothetical protein